MRTADREFRREVRRLVGATGKVCREMTWHEGQSGVRQRHFYEKWKRAELDNVIGQCFNGDRNRKGMSAAELAALVKEELVNIAERYKRQTVSAAPKKAPKAKKAD
jgi:hypothetical protein